MFTGLVEEIGDVVSLDATADGTILEIQPPNKEFLASETLGSSIAVEGTCLTVKSIAPDRTAFTVGLAPETLRRTALGTLAKGHRVNLERACRADTRLGGHVVQGHVDTVATIESVVPDGEALVYRFQPRQPGQTPDHQQNQDQNQSQNSGQNQSQGSGQNLTQDGPRPEEIMTGIVEKGYVAIDGVSLTVTAVNRGQTPWFEIMLIAYTQEHVTLSQKKSGQLVNVEVDMMGKYVAAAVEAYLQPRAGIEGPKPSNLVKQAPLSSEGSQSFEARVDDIVERKVQEILARKGLI